MRLQKFMSDCGFSSRRKAEALILAGRVFVNGKVAHLGDKVDPSRDSVVCDSTKILKGSQELLYIMLNKPRGYVTTLRDEFSRKCIEDLTKSIKGRVYPVGRLDKDSEGLIFLTNDGSFANGVMHPSSGIEKTYLVTVDSNVNLDTLRLFRRGVNFLGEFLSAKSVKIVDKVLFGNKLHTVLEIILNEGKNRHIRKMCSALKLRVVKLKRVAIGSIRLGNLKIACYRSLTSAEVKSVVQMFKSNNK